MQHVKHMTSATFTVTVDDVKSLNPHLNDAQAQEILASFQHNDAPAQYLRECLWTAVNDYTRDNAEDTGGTL